MASTEGRRRSFEDIVPFIVLGPMLGVLLLALIVEVVS